MDTTAARVLKLEQEIANLAARLDGFELRFPVTVRSATAALDALDDGLQRMGVGFVALAERVAELEDKEQTAVKSDLTADNLREEAR